MIMLAESSSIEELARPLGPNDAGFLQRVYADGLSKYETRLRQIGFHQLDRVLDAGCGFGQWSFALAETCQSVVGIDASQVRISVCESLRQVFGAYNAEFQVANLQALPFKNASMDGIFCYSAIFFTDYRKTIAEFSRVLRPGGLVYICANGPGRYLFEIVHNPHSVDDFNMRTYAIKTFLNSLFGRWQNFSLTNGVRIMSPRKTCKVLQSCGLHILGVGPEASVRRSEFSPVGQAFHAPTFWGLTNVFEILAVKKD
ncbi:MAG: class I SAM-dependent methyltransferase [Calditrichaeota bacterium]|nr:MAG: class I SAM-dependent methyltransferase [Calditrichota bacterium]